MSSPSSASRSRSSLRLAFDSILFFGGSEPLAAYLEFEPEFEPEDFGGGGGGGEDEGIFSNQGNVGRGLSRGLLICFLKSFSVKDFKKRWKQAPFHC